MKKVSHPYSGQVRKYEVTLAPYSTRFFSTASVLFVFWLARHRQFVFWLVVISIIFINRRLSHRAITVCHFISDYNAVRRLPVFWSTTVQRDVLFDAFSVHAHVVLTRTPLPSEASTQTRFPTRRWSTSKLTDHRWKFSFKSKLCALLHRSCIDQIV